MYSFLLHTAFSFVICNGGVMILELAFAFAICIPG